MHNINVHQDAFSSGQIGSKLWLCEELEKISFSKPVIVWIYGGWHGVMSLLLLSRNKLLVKHVRSFDIVPECEKVADSILNYWVWNEWKFKAFTFDCNLKNIFDGKFGEKPDIIINTSSEHFETKEWFENIPTDTIIVIQNNNMPHSDHVCNVSSVDGLIKEFPMRRIFYSGEIDFVYPEWKFKRFMTIGKK